MLLVSWFVGYYILNKKETRLNKWFVRSLYIIYYVNIYLIKTDLRRVSVHDAESLLSLVAEGVKRRRTAATKRNSTSSRSHALLEIATPHATLHLADLAGRYFKRHSMGRHTALSVGVRWPPLLDLTQDFHQTVQSHFGKLSNKKKLTLYELMSSKSFNLPSDLYNPNIYSISQFYRKTVVGIYGA